MKKIPLNIEWSTELLLKDTLSELEQDWLFDNASLTQKLRRLSDDQFFVEVLLGSWQLAREDECQKLNIAPDKACWIREVLLFGADRPWVYARSVASKTSLNHIHYNLDTIGSKPLGEILFSDDSFRRSPLEVTRYPMSLLPAGQQYSNLWARRSNFINNEINVLVQEIFLPDFWQKLQRG